MYRPNIDSPQATAFALAEASLHWIDPRNYLIDQIKSATVNTTQDLRTVAR
jgi:hypothetical protein